MNRLWCGLKERLNSTRSKNGNAPQGASERQRLNSRGYTVVEVMIVLAITGIIFASSVTIFAGRRSSVEFSQAMQDLQSELQSLSTQTISSNLSSVGSGNYCGLTATLPPRPYLSSSSTGQNECIYLGKAIQIVPNSSNMYIYPVLGLKDINGDPTNGQPANPSQANSNPAVDSNGNPILYTTYSLLNGAQFKASGASSHAAHLVGSNTEADFLAIYSNLQSGNITGSDTSASVSAYTASNVGTPADFSNLTKCVQQASPCTGVTNLTATNAWSICVQDPRGSRTAGLIIKSSSTGITTSVNMDTCP